MELRFIVKIPSECTGEEIHGFKNRVIEGGEVIQNGLEMRIDDAHLLGFCFEGNTLVGIAALKRPNDGYRDDVFAKAKSSYDAASFNREVGWAFTDDRYRKRGVCSKILRELMEASKDQDVFATSRVTNQGVHKMLGSLGFIQGGSAYQGRNEKILLFLRASNVEYKQG